MHRNFTSAEASGTRDIADFSANSNFGILKFRPLIGPALINTARALMSRPAKDKVTRDNKPISAPSGGTVTRDCRTIRNGTVVGKGCN